MECGRTTNPEPANNSLKKYRGDYIGMRFGSLTVIAYPTNSKGIRRAGAFCKCDCGEEEFHADMGDLFKGRIDACKKCRKKRFSEKCKKRNLEHPLTSRRGKYYKYRDERLYKVWMGMKNRCGKYGCYKDVSVCDEWQDYLNFRKWAYTHGYDQDAPRGACTIDRINPFGNYEPSNCRWADAKTQRLNTRKRWANMDSETKELMLSTILQT